MRRNYFKELILYRNANTAKQSKEAGGAVKGENRINVVMFDELEGLDPEMLGLINQKI